VSPAHGTPAAPGTAIARGLDTVRHEYAQDSGGWSRPAAQRFLLYSHDSWGLGRLRRCLTLAAGLTRAFPRAEVLLITGSPCATLFPTPERVGGVLSCAPRYSSG